MALVDTEELKQTLWEKCDEYDFGDDYKILAKKAHDFNRGMNLLTS